MTFTSVLGKQEPNCYNASNPKFCKKVVMKKKCP